MSENVIYTDRDQPIDEALATMSDRWLASGAYCEQTVIDLRDRLREHRTSLTKLVSLGNVLRQDLEAEIKQKGRSPDRRSSILDWQDYVSQLETLLTQNKEAKND